MNNLIRILDKLTAIAMVIVSSSMIYAGGFHSNAPFIIISIVTLFWGGLRLLWLSSRR